MKRIFVRLPKELDQRLAVCAERSGKPKALIAREAILANLDALEARYGRDATPMERKQRN